MEGEGGGPESAPLTWADIPAGSAGEVLCSPRSDVDLLIGDQRTIVVVLLQELLMRAYGD